MCVCAGVCYFPLCLASLKTQTSVFGSKWMGEGKQTLCINQAPALQITCLHRCPSLNFTEFGPGPSTCVGVHMWVWLKGELKEQTVTLLWTNMRKTAQAFCLGFWCIRNKDADWLAPNQNFSFLYPHTTHSDTRECLNPAVWLSLRQDVA